MAPQDKRASVESCSGCFLQHLQLCHTLRFVMDGPHLFSCTVLQHPGQRVAACRALLVRPHVNALVTQSAAFILTFAEPLPGRHRADLMWAPDRLRMA